MLGKYRLICRRCSSLIHRRSPSVWSRYFPQRPAVVHLPGHIAAFKSSHPVYRQPASASITSLAEPGEPAATSKTSTESTQQEPAREALPEVIAELEQRGIHLPDNKEGQYTRLLCPACKGGDSDDRAFSVKLEVDSAVWLCYRGKCGWTGGFNLAEARRRAAYTKPNPVLEPLSDTWLDFFKQRCIDSAILERNGIKQSVVNGKVSPVLVFPYFRDGELINVKYRTIEKKFWQSRGAEKILYALDDIKDAAEIIIVEGEMDKLSLEVAGFSNATSVPDGAPSQVRRGPLPPPHEDTKFSYVWNSMLALKKASRILLATDNDAPGRVLAEELARRLGPERCWLVSWSVPPAPGSPAVLDAGLQAAAPSDGAAGAASYKDANEVLIAAGPSGVRACLAAAVPYPVPGLSRVSTFAPELLNEYAHGPPPLFGLCCGWHNLDRLYQVRPGCVTVVAGPPMAGKSEFVLDLLCRLGRLHKFKAGISACELSASTAIVKRLLEKHSGKAFAKNGAGHPQMSPAELQAGLQWLDRRFIILNEEAGPGPSIAHVLNLARIASAREKLNGLLIDSFQALRPCPDTAAGLNEVMGGLKSFAQKQKLHIWLVVHTLDRAEADYLLNLSDIGITLQREEEQVQCAVVETSNRQCAKHGSVMFRFSAANGRFTPV